MNLEDYMNSRSAFFTRQGMVVEPEEDNDRKYDKEIIKCIVEDNPDIASDIIIFGQDNPGFIRDSLYPNRSMEELNEISFQLVNELKKLTQKTTKEGKSEIEAFFTRNSAVIDHRRLLLNTIITLRGAIAKAHEEGSMSKASLGVVKKIHDRLVEESKRFRPNVENPEIYVFLPPRDSKNIAEMLCFNWDEIIENKCFTGEMPDLGLTSSEMHIIEQLLNLEDIRMLPNSRALGKAVEGYLVRAFKKYDIKNQKLSNDNLATIVRELVRKPEYRRRISIEKLHFIGLYRMIEYAESYIVDDDKDFNDMPDKYETLALISKLRNLMNKDYAEGRRIKEPFDLLSDNRKKLIEATMDVIEDNGNVIGICEKLTVERMNDYYHAVKSVSILKMLKQNPISAIDLLQKKLINYDEFTDIIMAANETLCVALINKAYDKRIIGKEEIQDILEELSYRKDDFEEKFSKKLAIAEIQYMNKRIKTPGYKNNFVLDEMILSGIINQESLIDEYFKGTLNEEDLTDIANYIENSDATQGKVGYEKLRFDPKVFAQVYTQINLKKIVNTLVNKEHFDKELLADFMKARPYLIRNMTPEQLKKQQRIFMLQKGLLKKLDDKAQKEFMESLGYVAYSQGIAFDLFNRGLISKYVAEAYGGTEFIKQYQKTQLVDGLRHNDLSSIKNLINAYKYGRISLSKVLKKYAEGELSPEIYFAFKENRDMTEAVDKSYLIKLYDQYYKTGKDADLMILERYYQEVDSIIKDEKELEEIHKKQLELIKTKRKNKTTIITMARKGIIHKSNISMMDIETIAQLIMDGNALTKETAVELFRDTDGSTVKREKLEELFKRGILTQDEMFTILSNVYIGNVGSTPEEEENDTENMNYFFDQDYLSSEYDEIVGRRETTRKNGKGEGTIKPEQQRFPMKERMDVLYSLEKGKINIYKAGPAIILKLPGKGKVIIETLGTPGKGGRGTIADLTNHCTYIMPIDEFEARKKDLFERREAPLSGQRREVESVLMYQSLIDLYKECGKAIGMKRYAHKDYWKSCILKYFEENGETKIANPEIEDKDIGD